MNTLTTITTEYIRSSRTIETVLVSNSKIKKLFYVYNYEGVSFRVFKSLLLLLQFFEIGAESDVHFESEVELDNFLSTIELT